MTNKSHFLYKTHIDTFLHYFGGYYATEQFGSTRQYSYWVEAGYHCRANLKNLNQYRIAVENETFWVVVARQRDNMVQEIALGVP